MQFLNRKFIFIVLFSLSLLANGTLVLLYANAAGRLHYEAKAQQVNLKILSFTNQFIEKVLMSSQEVDFDTRLMLETMVRDLENPEILSQWQAFTNAQDNQTASREAKNLLNLLVKKISY